MFMSFILTNLQPFSRSILGKSKFWVITFIVIPIFGRFFPEANSDLVEYVVERNPSEFVFVEREKKTPLYVIALASDRQEKIDRKGECVGRYLK